MSYVSLAPVATGDLATAALHNQLLADIAILKASIDDNGHLRYPTKQVKTTTYSVVVTDDVVECNGTFTVTMPDATTCAGRFFIIKNNGTGVITIAAVSAQTFDTASTYLLEVQYQSATLWSDSGNWVLL